MCPQAGGGSNDDVNVQLQPQALEEQHAMNRSSACCECDAAEEALNGERGWQGRQLCLQCCGAEIRMSPSKLEQLGIDCTKTSSPDTD